MHFRGLRPLCSSRLRQQEESLVNQLPLDQNLLKPVHGWTTFLNWQPLTCSTAFVFSEWAYAYVTVFCALTKKVFQKGLVFQSPLLLLEESKTPCNSVSVTVKIGALTQVFQTNIIRWLWTFSFAILASSFAMTKTNLHPHKVFKKVII